MQCNTTSQPKLFLVTGKRSNGWANRFVNFGDNCRKRFSFSQCVIAFSPKEAIDKVWNGLEGEYVKYRATALKVQKEVEALVKADRHEEAQERAQQGFSFIGGGFSPIPPDVPRDREQWVAREVKVEGYRIAVEPETV